MACSDPLLLSACTMRARPSLVEREMDKGACLSNAVIRPKSIKPEAMESILLVGQEQQAGVARVVNIRDVGVQKPAAVEAR